MALITVFLILFVLFIAFSIISTQYYTNPYSTRFPVYSSSISSFLSAYLAFMSNIISGNWGILGHAPNNPIYTGKVSLWVGYFFPSSFEELLIAGPIALIISFPLGRYLGTHHHSRFSGALRAIVVAGYVTPAYVVALALQIIFGRGVIDGNPLGMLPVTGALSPLMFGFLNQPPSWMLQNGLLISSPTHMILLDAILHLNSAIALNALAHLVLPVTALVIGLTGVMTFMLDAGYADNMGMEYVRSARSRGLTEKKIVIKHVRKNALFPSLASATIMIAYLFSNIIMIEYVFSYPGIGLFLIVTIENGQYYPAAVVIFLIALVIIAMGTIIDTIYYIENPLIRK